MVLAVVDWEGGGDSDYDDDAHAIAADASKGEDEQAEHTNDRPHIFVIINAEKYWSCKMEMMRRGKSSSPFFVVANQNTRRAKESAWGKSLENH